jgi:hypothetical protein
MLPTLLIDVVGRWGYSEIVDAMMSKHYDRGHEISELRTKRTSVVPFEDLTAAERYNLAFQCALVRPALLGYLFGIESFDIVDIDREALSRLFVPPNVWRDSQGKFCPFSHYAGTTTDEVDDARTIVIDRAKYRVPRDPLTVGRSNGYHIMLDGYHRAMVFWKFGPADGKLQAFMPR